MRRFLLLLLLLPLEVLTTNACFAAKNFKVVKKKKKKKKLKPIEKQISAETQELNLLLKDLNIEMGVLKKDIVTLKGEIKKSKKKKNREKLQKKLAKKVEDRKLLKSKIKAVKKDREAAYKSNENFKKTPPNIAIVAQEDYLDLYINDDNDDSDNKKTNHINSKDIIKKEKELNTFLNNIDIPKAQKEALLLLAKQISSLSKESAPGPKKYLHNNNIMDSIHKIATIFKNIEKNSPPTDNVEEKILAKYPTANINKEICYGLQIGIYKHLDLYETHNKKEAKIFLRQDIDGDMYKYTLGPFETFEAAVKFRKILTKMGLFLTSPDIVPIKKDMIVDYDESIQNHIRKHK